MTWIVAMHRIIMVEYRKRITASKSSVLLAFKFWAINWWTLLHHREHTRTHTTYTCREHSNDWPTQQMNELCSQIKVDCWSFGVCAPARHILASHTSAIPYRSEHSTKQKTLIPLIDAARRSNPFEIEVSVAWRNWKRMVVLSFAVYCTRKNSSFSFVCLFDL